MGPIKLLLYLLYIINGFNDQKMEKLKKDIQLVVDVYKSGDFYKAELLVKELIVANSKVVFLYNLLGLILVEQKKIDEAIKCYEDGIKIDPNFSMIYNNLGLLYFRHKEDPGFKKAENYYKKAISLDKKLSEAHNNLGSLYRNLNKFHEAIDCYKNAININPKFSFAHHNLGAAYVSLGMFDDARDHFKEAIKLNPNFVDTHRMFSRIIKYSDKNEHLDQLEKLYNKIDEKDLRSKVEIGFSLGKAYEDMNDFDKSFSYYNEANSLHRKSIKYSFKDEKDYFNQIKDTYTSKLYNKYINSGYFESSPIFIIGMPRSGTTLVEQILSSHKEVYGADEVEYIYEIIRKNFSDKNPRLFFDEIVKFDKENLKRYGEEYTKKMNNISNSSPRTTDKFPANFLNVGFIKLILPKSKVIHCQRNPEDNCFSIFKNHFGSGKITFAYNLEETVQYYNLYNDLMKYWINLLPNFVYNIKYENLISNTKSEVEKLLKYCDLEWSDSCLNFHKNKRPIKTASDTQVRRKIYKSSMDSWKNYEKYFAKYFKELI